MTPGRIAAVITCHELGRTLREALDSVERQTRPAAEIVIVDDASTDIYTRQVVDRMEREGNRVVRAGGKGAAAARNTGARLTSADYLVWLDADDVLEPGYFAAAGDRLDADAAIEFVSCAMRAFGAASYTWTPGPPTFVNAVATGSVPHASSMIRRRAWEAVGGFDETLRSFELLDFWAAVIKQGGRGIVLDEPLLRYRVRAGSGYRRSIQTETYLDRLRHFYSKHHDAVREHGPELIEGKEAFLLSQREYQKMLEARVASLEGEMANLGREIEESTRRLESRGLSRLEWGDLRRVEPVSPLWGRDRGTPIDRYYIERFLDAHRADVHGRVLEVRDSAYTRRFGGSAVTSADVVDIDPSNEQATIVADLRQAAGIPTAAYDCIILTQTLHLVDDIGAVLQECARMLRPGGVLLATAPSVIRVDDEAGPDGDFWRLTEASARRLFAGVFPPGAFDVSASGNVCACAAFLYGISVEEMSPADLDPIDPAFPLVIAVRAVKPHQQTVEAAAGAAPAVRAQGPAHRAAILAYHRVATLDPDSHKLCTPPDVFREHMACLARDFTPIGLEDLVRAAAAGRIPERAVAVTFDDGYLDALTVVSPILVSLGVPATFFVNSDRLNEPHERWWDILERLFMPAAALPALLDLQIAGQHLRVPAGTPAERASALELLNRTAWPLDAANRHRLLTDVLAWSGAAIAPRSTHRVLTDEEIQQLANRPGHSVGAHTVHHLALTTQPVETKRHEVLADKAALESILARPVHLFSYPYGDVDAELLGVVREAGFLAAVTVEAGAVCAGTNRLLLPRHEIDARAREDFPRFVSRVLS